MKFVIVNGLICEKEEAKSFDFPWNSPITISQKIWFGYGGIPLLLINIGNLKEQLATIGTKLPELFGNQRELSRLLKRMLNKNKFYRSGHIHITIFVAEHNINWVAEAVNSTNMEFPFRETGLGAVCSGFTKMSTNPLGRYSIHNQLIWKASLASENSAATNRPLIFNEKEILCEAIEANVFLVKKGVLVTPSLLTGCYNDNMRQIVVDLAAENKIPLIESDEINKKILLAADEIFLASEANGIEWIVGLENKRFIRKYALTVYERIVDYLKQAAQENKS